MDGDPLHLDLGARIVGGHLEVDRQLPDSILPSRRASVEDMHDGALQKILGIVHVAEDVLRGWSLRTLLVHATIKYVG